MNADGDLVDVVLLGLPVEDFRRSQQYHDALLREFALIDSDTGGASSGVPVRLTALVHELSARFGRFSVEPEAHLRDAVERGVARIDVRFRVPPAAKDASLELDRLLDEVDDYCRRGDLLTLAAPPDVRSFRRRYLEEFVRQIDGGEPRPWAEG